ncbi:uncharacterized protein M6B38_294550 [Iris pallida]|uniref:Transmembrane protein n=1 Tax=Iris pallida TaxID=29817 RepID=A0AAX6HTC2_IRIPA|nr:uncharacterized protein M6B38_294550 [Iris pallida]
MVVCTRSVIAWRILFVAMGCSMLAALLYTLITDGSPFRRELLTPWLSAILIDFYVKVVPISIWVVYKEQTWFGAFLWVALLVCFGSITTCTYIAKQFFDISLQEPVYDPVSHVLLRNDRERKLMCFSVVFGRVLFSMLAVMMLVIIIYTAVTDGLPFRMELLTPWMTATLVDTFIHSVVLSVWVAHKEMTWTSAIVWICLSFCCGSTVTCAYIAIQLFQLSCQDPMFHILLDSPNKYAFTPSKNC